jgi:hypothetical protein
MSCGYGLSRCCGGLTLRRSRDAHALMHGEPWMALSFDCGRDANGIICREFMETTVGFIGALRAGANGACSKNWGRAWCATATS